MLKKCFFKVVNNLEETITTFFLFIMCISVLLQLFYRYFLKNPLIYTEEIARYAYIWVTFIGLSLSTKTKEHIRIDFLIEKLPGKIKNLVNIMMGLVTLGFLVLLTYWGVKLVNFNRVMLSPALRMPLYLIYCSLPLGTALASLRTIQSIIGDCLSLKTNNTISGD